MELTVSPIRHEFPASDGEPGFVLDLPAIEFNLSAVTYLVGHNGSGKSVLLRLLSGELAPSHGAVLFSVGDRVWDAQSEPCGIVHQRADDCLAVDLTVRENVLLHGEYVTLVDRLRPRVRLAEHTRRVLEGFPQLDQKLDQPCRNLSVGQRQLLAFLLHASHHAPVLLLDEFLSATDPGMSALLRRLAAEYARRVPACVLVASHHLDHALADAERILILRQGRLLRDLNRASPEWNAQSLLSLLGHLL